MKHWYYLLRRDISQYISVACFYAGVPKGHSISLDCLVLGSICPTWEILYIQKNKTQAYVPLL